MKTLLAILMSASLSAWSQVEMPKRTLKSLYSQINNNSNSNKAEQESLVLKDYNMIVLSGTWWSGAAQAEIMWNSLAQKRLKELNVVVVYDAPKQDFQKIKSKSLNTEFYEFFDQQRSFYYWFQNNTLMNSVLFGPDGKILFEGLLNSQEKIEQVLALIKQKEV